MLLLSRKKYSYWGWSIVKIFESLPTLKKFIRKKNLQTIEIYNRKYKLWSPIEIVNGSISSINDIMNIEK